MNKLIIITMGTLMAFSAIAQRAHNPVTDALTLNGETANQIKAAGRTNTLGEVLTQSDDGEQKDITNVCKVIAVGDGASAGFNGYVFSDTGSTAPEFLAYRASGTRASPGAISNQQNLGVNYYFGLASNGTWQVGGGMYVRAVNDWAANGGHENARLYFFCRSDGTVYWDAMVLNENRNLILRELGQQGADMPGNPRFGLVGIGTNDLFLLHTAGSNDAVRVDDEGNVSIWGLFTGNLGGGTNYAASNLVDYISLVRTNEPDRVVTLDHAGRSTNNDIFLELDFVTKKHHDNSLEELLPVSLYGAVTLHPVVTNAGILTNSLTGYWETTNSLAVGTNVLGTWGDVTAITDVLNSGTRVLHWHAYHSGAGNPTVQYYVEYSVIDGSTQTTNLLATSERIDSATTIVPLTAYAHVLTNYVVTVSNYQAVTLYGVRVGGANATAYVRGGTEDYDSYLSGASVSDGVGKQPYSDNLTKLAGNDGGSLTNLTIPWESPVIDDLPTNGAPWNITWIGRASGSDITLTDFNGLLYSGNNYTGAVVESTGSVYSLRKTNMLFVLNVEETNITSFSDAVINAGNRVGLETLGDAQAITGVWIQVYGSQTTL